MDKIYAYNTHYEIMDYHPGDFARLEKDLSLWDDIYFRPIEKYYYDEESCILYIPRGYDPYILEQWSGQAINYTKGPTDRKRMSFFVDTPPRDAEQKEAIRFLTGKGEFESTYTASQLVLSLPTGGGKTYCSIATISLLGCRTMVIVSTDNLRQQWKEKFLEYSSNITDENIHVIDGDLDKLYHSTEKKLSNYYIYITTHSTLRNYMKKNGISSLSKVMEKLGIGIKIIDEAHKEYSNTLMIDYGTNVWKTIYLTATFARTDNDDDKIFQRCFDKIHKMKGKVGKVRRHVIYMPIIYRTKPNYYEMAKVRGRKGFDRYNYINYELEKGVIDQYITKILQLLIETKRTEGKIIILSSKKETCDHFYNLVKELYPAYSCCAHYTGHKIEDYKSYGIICATPKMLGEGEDIKGLRIVINTEPTRSITNTIQIFGRLREYAPDKSTYYIELVDRGFTTVWDMYKVRKKYLETVAEKVVPWDNSIIKY